MPSHPRDLFTGRLVRFAAPRPEDAEAFMRWSEDPDYQRNVDTDFARPKAAQPEMPGASANGVEFRLRALEDDRLIGFLAIHSIEWNNQSGVLSMGIGEAAYRGKGYGSDALWLALHYAFNELNLYRVGLDVISTNARAIRAYEKAGFRREGALRASVLRDGARADRVLMSILRPEWDALKREAQAAPDANQ